MKRRCPIDKKIYVYILISPCNKKCRDKIFISLFWLKCVFMRSLPNSLMMSIPDSGVALETDQSSNLFSTIGMAKEGFTISVERDKSLVFKIHRTLEKFELESFSPVWIFGTVKNTFYFVWPRIFPSLTCLSNSFYNKY